VPYSLGMGSSVLIVSLVFFLATILLFQTVTFSSIALAQSPQEDIQIPSWFKSNAKWWKEDKISDGEIVNAIENLLDQGIIKLDSNKIKSTIATSETSSSLPQNKDDVRIPSYVKEIFVFWEGGLVSDSDVAGAIKFLTEENIIIISSSPIHKQPRQSAAIIDQLHDFIKNKHFLKKSQQFLELAGYDVDVYTTEDITVDFYKNLPSMNYKFIIIRTHSLEDPESKNPTFLFTGEKFDMYKYTNEQIFDQVSRGIPIYGEELEELIENNEYSLDKMYFVVGSKLFDDTTVGKFPDSIIFIGGCEVMRSKDLANSLINRGASSVIGWDRSINSSESDRVMLALLEEVLIDKIEINDAILSVMQEFGSDLEYSSQLHHVQR